MLAVLNSGGDSDNTREMLEHFKDFDIGFVQQDRGLKISLTGAPALGSCYSPYCVTLYSHAMKSWTADALTFSRVPE
jgi:hypothetical protein